MSFQLFIQWIELIIDQNISNTQLRTILPYNYRSVDYQKFHYITPYYPPILNIQNTINRLHHTRPYRDKNTIVFSINLPSLSIHTNRFLGGDGRNENNSKFDSPIYRVEIKENIRGEDKRGEEERKKERTRETGTARRGKVAGAKKGEKEARLPRSSCRYALPRPSLVEFFSDPLVHRENSRVSAPVFAASFAAFLRSTIDDRCNSAGTIFPK